MLGSMRKHMKKLSWVLWVVIATFIGTIFAVWGMGGSGRRSGKNVVAVIDEKPVSAKEFYEARKRVKSFYQKIYGNRFNEIEKRLQLSETALSQIIDTRALMKAAKKLGVIVPMTDIIQDLKTYPAFQVKGHFSKNRFKRLLKYNHITEKDFLKELRQDVARKRVKNILQDAFWATNDELKANYRLDNEKARLEFLQISARAFSEKLNPTDEQLKTFFEKNKKDYQVPDKVSVSYVEINPADMLKRENFKKKISIDDDEIETYYYDNQDKFESEKEVRASHILIKSSGKDPIADKKAKDKIMKILVELKNNEDFASLAKKYSEDSSAAKGGDLGFFKRHGAMVEPFASVAFRLKKGAISDIVKSQFGYHIIKVTDIKKATSKSLDDATPEITKILTAEKAKELSGEEAERMREYFDTNNDIKALAKRFKLTVKETKLFAQKDILKELGWAPDFMQAAFDLKKKQISPVVKVNDKFFLITLKNRVPAHQAALDEVKTKVSQDWIDKVSIEQANAKMKEIQTKALKSQNWGKLADGQIVKLGDSGLFSRKQSIKGIGKNEQLTLDTFLKPINSIIGPLEIKNNVFLIRITDRKEPDWKNFEQNVKNLQAQTSFTKGALYFNKWLENFKKQMKIEKNQTFFANLSSNT